MDFLSYFANPGFFAISAALISVPIIIHLINRLRFKRLHWAAMEFLLKAQKRNRRRLIIEQLILLALRCLLVALIGLLVMRFVGDLGADFGKKKAAHLVILDDTLSMNDQWNVGETTKNCFQVATREILLDKIARAVSQSGANDKLMVLPLSKLDDTSYQLREHDRLNNADRLKELRGEVEMLEPSMLHVDILRGVKKAKELAQNMPDTQITLHVLSDFRQRDWGQAEGEALHKELVDFAKNHKAKIRLVDTAHPERSTGQAGMPQAHDNVGILDFRPGTRIAGKDMPITFTLTLANYSSREADVWVSIHDDRTGGEQLQIDFNPTLPLKIPAGSTIQATFDHRFSPQLKPGEVHFGQLSARLESAQRGKLENDGLPHDNVRYAAVEVRDQVPILVIDGEARAGREDDRIGKDSFYLQTALGSVPGASYRVEFGDMLGGTAGVAPKALERPDLRNYPTIFLLNVRELNPKQLANLETYVREGGGVGFFLGPQVSVPYYNKMLFKDGKGVFPAKLKDPYFPPPNEAMREPQPTNAPMLLLRDDLFPSLPMYPIFGAVFKDSGHRDVLTDLPIKRYFQLLQTPWRKGEGQVAELATLPNDLLARDFTAAALTIIGDDLDKVLENNKEFDKYKKGLDRHRIIVRNVVRPTSEKTAHDLALAFDEMLNDTGKETDRAQFPNLTELWSDSDPKVRSLRNRIVDLRDQVRFGDPFVLAANHGSGKVVAVMTTAGKAWNDWGGGSRATTIYQPFVWEMQNYLSSQSSESNLTVAPIAIHIDSEPYKQNNRRLRMDRTFSKAVAGAAAESVKDSESFGDEKQGQLTFSYGKNLLPGLYVSHLVYDDAPEKKLAAWGHVFDVDTASEGPLQRVSYEELKSNVLDKAEGMVNFEGANVLSDDLVSRRSDLSENPLLFLLFLAVLVAEQALAVHLSFHLKGGENIPVPQVGRQAA